MFNHTKQEYFNNQFNMPVEEFAMPLEEDVYKMKCMPYMCYPFAESCIPQETVIANVKLARAYVPFQKLCTTFDLLEGLDKGTIFPELYSPFISENKHAKPCGCE